MLFRSGTRGARGLGEAGQEEAGQRLWAEAVGREGAEAVGRGCGMGMGMQGLSLPGEVNCPAAWQFHVREE